MHPFSFCSDLQTIDALTRLSNWPWVVVRVDCKLCPRRGTYRLARLAHHFGPEMDLKLLLNQLAADCPWGRGGRTPRKNEARCGVRFTDWDHRRPTVDTGPHRNAPGPPPRTLTIADLPGPTVVIICRPCRRRGVLRVDRLIARFAADLPLPTLLTQLAVGCPGMFENTPRCKAVYEKPIG